MLNADTLNTARSARVAAREKHTEALAALGRAQEARSAAAAEVERLAAEEKSWLDRHAQRLRAWIIGGSTGPRPEPKADAAVLVKQASARAQLVACDAALADFEQAELHARQALADADRRVDDVKRGGHTGIAGDLFQRLRALDAERMDIVYELAAPACAGELYGVKAAFVGILTPEQLAYVNSPPPRAPQVADVFSPAQRGVVDINMPVSGSRSLLEKYLARWYGRDAAFERGELPPSPQPRAEAAAA